HAQHGADLLHHFLSVSMAPSVGRTASYGDAKLRTRSMAVLGGFCVWACAWGSSRHGRTCVAGVRSACVCYRRDRLLCEPTIVEGRGGILSRSRNLRLSAACRAEKPAHELGRPQDSRALSRAHHRPAVSHLLSGETGPDRTATERVF